MDMKATNFILFGATGDLSRRMLLPSLYYLDRDGLLPEKLTVVGAARSTLSHKEFIALARKSLEERGEGVHEPTWKRFSARLHYSPVDAGAASGLVNVMQQLGGALGLAVLVTVFGAASSGAHTAGLSPAEATRHAFVVGADRSFWTATLFLVGTWLLVTFAIRARRPEPVVLIEQAPEIVAETATSGVGS